MTTTPNTQQPATLNERQQAMREEAIKHNAGRKPAFGDLMRNPWAGESNPQRDAYFVRSLHVTGKFNPGLWYEMTDKRGKFWSANGDTMMFLDAQRPSTESGRAARNLHASEILTACKDVEPSLPGEHPDVYVLAIARKVEDAVRSMIGTYQPAPVSTEKHPDDIAVDKFSEAMKVKMAVSRAKGRGGWDKPDECSIEKLASMMVSHVAKGDPVDIGNFAMMLHVRGLELMEHHPCRYDEVRAALRFASVGKKPISKEWCERMVKAEQDFGGNIEAGAASVEAHADAASDEHCRTCRGEGVIHTGIEEAPVTECTLCDGTGFQARIALPTAPLPDQAAGELTQSQIDKVYGDTVLKTIDHNGEKPSNFHTIFAKAIEREVRATAPAESGLTDEQIDALMVHGLPNTRPSAGFRTFARAIEARAKAATANVAPVEGVYVPIATLHQIFDVMNHMGDQLNEMDVVDEADVKKCTPAFEAMESLLPTPPTGSQKEQQP